MEFTYIAISVLVLFILFYMWSVVKKPNKPNKPKHYQQPKTVKKDPVQNTELTQRIIRRFNDGSI